MPSSGLAGRAGGPGFDRDDSPAFSSDCTECRDLSDPAVDGLWE